MPLFKTKKEIFITEATRSELPKEFKKTNGERFLNLSLPTMPTAGKPAGRPTVSWPLIARLN